MADSFKAFIKTRSRFLWVASLIVLAWFAFILLLKRPDMDAAPALIMTWVSVLVLLISLFPEVLDRVRRIKMKDFELELQEALEQDYISMITVPPYDRNHDAVVQKSDLSALASTLERISRTPDRHILLVANLRRGDHVSATMLFGYLFFLLLSGGEVTILFVSTLREIRDVTEIREVEVVGAADGMAVLQALLGRYPDLGGILDVGSVRDELTGYGTSAVDFFRTRRYNADDSVRFLSQFFSRFNVLDVDSHYLSSDELREILGRNLKTDILIVSREEFSTEMFRNALRRRDDYIVVSERGRPAAVLGVEDLSRRILEEMLRRDA